MTLFLYADVWIVSWGFDELMYDGLREITSFPFLQVGTSKWRLFVFALNDVYSLVFLMHALYCLSG